MGGCRCTYKNCTLKTDGVTHMFHYPVFDKVRCHQWLTNAQKLEFLNLKVSQLKNRVVCQHHFKDDNFMNFLKDKLTFDAVPTEDGPFCDSSQLADKQPVPEETKMYTISLEDIENEYLTINDKKANFSVKYGDFLTNCDLMDLNSINSTPDFTQIKIKTQTDGQNEILLNDIDHNDPKKEFPVNPILNKTLGTVQPDTNEVFTIHMSNMPPEAERPQRNLIQRNLCPASLPQVQNQGKNVTTHCKKKNGKSLLKKGNSKIRILNEEKVSDPLAVPFPVQLEPITPFQILQLPNKRKKVEGTINDNHSKLISPVIVEAANYVSEQPVSIEKFNNNTPVEASQKEVKSKNVNQGNSSKNTTANVMAITIPPTVPQNNDAKVNVKKSNISAKNRIPPEKMAAIEEKRKFNMKLRDIIASCLDKLDDEEEKNYDSSQMKSKIEKNITQKVSSYLAKKPTLPTMQDYTVAYLEARMKRMEDILLKKIDQNSERIIELKQSLTPAHSKRVAQTQTANEELQKKTLYQEISKYLSPAANSVIYEELFINKCAQKVSYCSPTKKRKNR